MQIILLPPLTLVSDPHWVNIYQSDCPQELWHFAPMLLLWMIVTNSRNYQMYFCYSRHKLGKHRGLEDIVVLPRFYIFPDQQYPTIVP